MASGPPYNPLDKLNLGQSVAQALLAREVMPLSDPPDIRGAGVYAIYYTGDFPPYVPIAERNRGGAFQQPIYVGKAIPRGGRKDGLTYDASKGVALRDRLRQHANSIDQAINLNVTDFQYRSLVVDDIWIPLGENMLIEQLRPIWNVLIDGFGNKDPGRRRATQYRSPWDVLHPGRAFADKLASGSLTQEKLIERIEAYFSGLPVPLVPMENAVDSGGAEDDETQPGVSRDPRPESSLRS